MYKFRSYDLPRATRKRINQSTVHSRVMKHLIIKLALKSHLYVLGSLIERHLA